jgi:hypothetical protein
MPFGGPNARGGARFFAKNKTQEQSTTKPVIINQPNSNAHPIIDKVSQNQLARNALLIKKANNDPLLISMLQQQELANIGGKFDLEEGLKLIDTLDPIFPLSQMTIPKLQDASNLEIANEVNQLLHLNKYITSSLKKSTTYLLFDEDDSKNQQMKDKYVDILHNQCSSIFPEELLIMHQQLKAKQQPSFNAKYQAYTGKLQKLQAEKRKFLMRKRMGNADY